MPALVLKAISAHAKPTPQDTTLGVVQPKPLTPKLIVKARAAGRSREERAWTCCARSSLASLVVR